MISDDLVQAYRRDGVIVVPEVLDNEWLVGVRAVLGELLAGAARVTEHTDLYDLEPGHTPENPRVRRIKAPQKVHPIFDEIVRGPVVISILTKLLGPGLRLHGAKLNMKSAQFGSPVEWHQDWAFYPHTNDDLLAIGVLLDDCDLENGPMLVTPGTHKGEAIWNHHGDDGCFAGLVDPDQIKAEIDRATCCSTKWPPATPGRYWASRISRSSTAASWPGLRSSGHGWRMYRCACHCRRPSARARSMRRNRRPRSRISRAQRNETAARGGRCGHSCHK